MDGGGRLARSLRRTGPETDHRKTAARLAADLRARLSRLLPPTFAKSKLRDDNLPRVFVLLERRLPRRFGLIATALILTASAGLGVVKGGHVGQIVEVLSDTRNAIANAAGFQITAVAVSGRKQLSQDEILAIGGVNGRSSLLFLDAATVRGRLKANPWIADATVLKLYPGRLQIAITERSPFALWQQDGSISVIADDGAVLEPYVARRFTSLPLVVGKGAATRAKDFLALLAQYPAVKPNVKAVVFVGERRWNLRLADGLDVRLPEHGVANALTALTRLATEERLMSRDITAIDMRLPDRLTVRLSEDAAKARNDALKDKKVKRKGNDA